MESDRQLVAGSPLQTGGNTFPLGNVRFGSVWEKLKTSFLILHLSGLGPIPPSTIESWKSPKPLQGPCQMDLENYHFSYFFKRRKNTNINRKVKLSISYKDFHCFELMGFAHIRFSPFDVSKKSFKKLTSEKTRISENHIKPNIISTFRPSENTTNF